MNNGENLEAALETIQLDAERWLWRKAQIAAIQFYLRDVLWQCGNQWLSYTHAATAYAELVAFLERWRYLTNESVTYVSFQLRPAVGGRGSTLERVACRRHSVIRREQPDTSVEAAWLS